MTFPDSIGLVGGIAVGKTSLGQALSKLCSDVTFLPDPANNNLFLPSFYKERGRWSFHSRISFLALRSEIYRESVSGKIAVIDRPVHELIVFATAHHKIGYLSDDEFQVFKSLHQTLVTLCPMPKLFVRVTCSPEEALRRIGERGRNFELGIDIMYLEHIENQYDEWLNTFAAATIITVRTDNDSPENIARSILPRILN